MNALSIEYKPGNGIIIEGIFIPWGAKRNQIRNTISGEYEVKDQEFAGIVSKRDIYIQFKQKPVFLIFNYDNHDQFSEFEIHKGVQLIILDKSINLQMDFLNIIETLDKISSNKKEITEDEVLFIDLKLNLCSELNMGGEQEGRQLSYIYCAEDISHLLS
jgi:hypothetical protein